MRKEKNTTHFNENQLPNMTVIDSTTQSQLEFEIERHVNSIRALIQKLHPIERQRYYDGLLSHILAQPINYPDQMTHVNDSYDYCNLSVDELSLIKELSVKMHELYRVSEGDLRN
jgi:hypothetical protein